MRSNLFLILGFLILSGCFRPPEFPLEPQIAFERLQLTDDANLILTFKVRDGDGDIGLNNESDYAIGEFPEDLFAPYHQNSWIRDVNDSILTFSSENHVGPYEQVPAIGLKERIPLLVYDASSKSQAVAEGEITSYFIAGDPEPFSDVDERPSEFDCNVFELIPSHIVVSDTFNVPGEQGEFIHQTIETVFDTIFVKRNPRFFNLGLFLEVKQGNQYIPIEEFTDKIADCDPIYTARFPVFDRSDFGRPLDGKISYRLFSVLFQDSDILQATMRMRFAIMDRNENRSDTVSTPDFRILDLRAGDLTN